MRLTGQVSKCDHKSVKKKSKVENTSENIEFIYTFSSVKVCMYVHSVVSNFAS